ncbi:FtsQ-type POTRA domain-containing protein [Streptomyces fructofermentans]|uniref:cell division protein FtsQ/DivIB n=1 Tax=Streptomyces fructofermentans TaxID=152141 RepID=UPI0033FD49AC
MAGPTTAERQQTDSGPLRAIRLRRPPGPRVLVVALLCLALVGAGCTWLLYGSQWLRVERVPVSGARVLTAGQVLEAADVPVGSPMVSVDTDAIEARLRQELPRIDSVEAVRSWPDAIGLKVTERTPVLIERKNGKFVEVDAKGVRYATVSRAPKGVPVLEVSASPSASLRRFGTERLVREAVRVAGSLPPAVARDTRVVKVRSYDSISLELGGRRTVEWGSGERARAKARTLTALMKAAPGARYFDVSVPTAPASSGS